MFERVAHDVDVLISLIGNILLEHVLTEVLQDAKHRFFVVCFVVVELFKDWNQLDLGTGQNWVGSVWVGVHAVHAGLDV